MTAARARGRWFSRSRGLEQGLFDSFHASLAAQTGRTARILAWTYCDEGVCIGGPSDLSVGDETGWQHIGWHQIEKGDWNSETRALRWSLYGGSRGTAHLHEPARLPELFRERIAASIVFEKFVPVRGERGVIISARRDLAHHDGPMTWHRSLSRGLTWDTPGVEALAESTIVQLRSEYDIA
ncbi:hypothetical protein JOE57_000673 [Microlunatus panaciterrae]|uniref:Uncharacterized protein n=1 Tax=Microlunatus panaciterrae TaxID=400768 RepID=A0ABS2RGT8_9ACTN|nr:hypothetical protein [Microlunatus panaciterrae]MBM7797752.1 hypothetical protein [Microlunatus panaciterrae]